MNGVPNKCMRAYCIIDEQSNTSLVDERVVDFFGKEFPTQEYCIKFASQNCEMNTSGSLVTGLKVRGVKEKEVIEVPQALSCASLSDTTSEVATPEIVLQDKHTAPSPAASQSSILMLKPSFSWVEIVVALWPRNASPPRNLTFIKPH